MWRYSLHNIGVGGRDGLSGRVDETTLVCVYLMVIRAALSQDSERKSREWLIDDGNCCFRSVCACGHGNQPISYVKCFGAHGTRMGKKRWCNGLGSQHDLPRPVTVQAFIAP